MCGYDPCKVVKCFNMPFASCLSDFRCKAVFFDSEEKKLDVCKGMLENKKFIVTVNIICLAIIDILTS